MRSKEVENAIERLKKGKNTAYIGSNTAIYFIKDVDTVLAYIEQLEKMIPTPSNEVPVEYQTVVLVDKRDAVMKSEIRDKIKELEEEYEDITNRKAGCLTLYREKEIELEFKIEVLKSIIGE